MTNQITKYFGLNRFDHPLEIKKIATPKQPASSSNSQDFMISHNPSAGEGQVPSKKGTLLRKLAKVSGGACLIGACILLIKGILVIAAAALIVGGVSLGIASLCKQSPRNSPQSTPREYPSDI